MRKHPGEYWFPCRLGCQCWLWRSKIKLRAEGREGTSPAKDSNSSVSDLTMLCINNEMGKSHSVEHRKVSSAMEIQWMKGEEDVRKH